MSTISFKVISDNQEILNYVLRNRNFEGAMYFNLVANPDANGGAGRQAGNVENFYTEPENKEGVIKFLGFSRIDDRPMFSAYRTEGFNRFDQRESSFGSDETIVNALQLPIPNENDPLWNRFYIGGLTNVRVELISSLEDHFNLPNEFMQNLFGVGNRAEPEPEPDQAARRDRDFEIEGLFIPGDRNRAIDISLYGDPASLGTAMLGTILARTILSDVALKEGVFKKLEEEFKYAAINNQFLHIIKNKIKITKDGLNYTDENEETRTLTSAGEIGLLFLQIINDLKENLSKDSQADSVKNFFDKLTNSSEQEP